MSPRRRRIALRPLIHRSAKAREGGFWRIGDLVGPSWNEQQIGRVERFRIILSNSHL